MTECKPKPFEFHPLDSREVVAHFDGGDITSDGGGLILREVEQRTGILKKFAACFVDYRDPEAIEHPVEDLVAQRAYGLCLGYEDLNDHQQLRQDPLLAVLVEKRDPTGQDRVRKRDQGKALAGKSTLNRLELTGTKTKHRKGEPSAAMEDSLEAEPQIPDRYKKIRLDFAAVDRMLVELFLASFGKEPPELVLDLDCTDDPVHGGQEGRFFHGYYGHYCYLPLYIVCGEHVLCARLRPSNIDAGAGCGEELKRIVAQIRERWPKVKIIVRGDSGFCREELLSWCEDNHVHYCIGLARNSRLQAEIEPQQEAAQQQFRQTGKAARVYHEFLYQTRKSWRQQRRVIAKAEYLEKGALCGDQLGGTGKTSAELV